MVKRTVRLNKDCIIYASSYLKIAETLSQNAGKISVLSPCSKIAFDIDFSIFLPFGPRETCFCDVEGRCKCTYEEFEASKVSDFQTLVHWRCVDARTGIYTAEPGS